MLDRYLSSFAVPELRFLGVQRSSYQLCGGIGFILAVSQSVILAARRGLPLWVIGAMAAAAVATFFALAFITKIVRGREALVYYHHEIAVVAAVTGLLWLLHQPVLAYLDIAVLGVGVFLACGRIGCSMVGCCHGKPHDWGIRYTCQHADAGFTRCYVGVCLLPVQLLESLWVFAVVAIGVAMVWRWAQTGEAIGLYLAAYGVGRFGFEFLRGDAERPYAWGFSEAQWISLVLVSGAAAAPSVSAGSFHSLHVVVALSIALTMIGLSITRRLRTGIDHRLFYARHLQEIARAIWPISALEEFPKDSVYVFRTSLGLQISFSRRDEPWRRVHHYAISRPDGTLMEKLALAVAGKISLLDPLHGAARTLVRGSSGVYHLLIAEPNLGFTPRRSSRPDHLRDQQTVFEGALEGLRDVS